MLTQWKHKLFAMHYCYTITKQITIPVVELKLMSNEYFL